MNYRRAIIQLYLQSWKSQDINDNWTSFFHQHESYTSPFSPHLLRILLFSSFLWDGEMNGDTPHQTTRWHFNAPTLCRRCKRRTSMDAVTKQNQAIGSSLNSPDLLKFSQQKSVLVNHCKEELLLPSNSSGSVEFNHPTQRHATTQNPPSGDQTSSKPSGHLFSKHILQSH